MTEQEVFKTLMPLVREITGAREDQVCMESVLMGELGAESIDLLDLRAYPSRLGLRIDL